MPEAYDGLGAPACYCNRMPPALSTTVHNLRGLDVQIVHGQAAASG